MVSFDPRVSVTTPAAWEAATQWDAVPPLGELPEELVVFSAHPDDETLGAGGLIARAARSGSVVRVVVATADPPERVGELEAALDDLGVAAAPDRVTVLGLPDGALKHHAPALRTLIADLLDRLPTESHAERLLLAPWTGDRHGDHRTLGREVAAAVRDRGESALLYPVWLWQWGTLEDVPWERVHLVPLTETDRRSKRAALSRFASQLRTSANRDGVLEPGFVERAATGREILIAPPPSAEEHFERMHRERDDPWRVRTRWYERRRRAVLAASLPHERYGRVIELGCSVGETTALLADRCDELLAVDGSAAAVETAAERVRDRPHATVERMRVPGDWPPGHADLVVVSELAYYLPEDEWDAVIDRIHASLRPGGEVLLCHWTGDADDFAQSGTSAHARFRERSALSRVVVHEDAGFVLEVFA
ncbi:bifunctional PIG-L family deacetylase/class I SAM-dependent methyltransferase [Leifsonia sp. NPDC077715]|uniref:bifunctional PIG-L family deacetylase/class I SAM-dependent methyltransferase n=1 Tax=Leifsonia sp. NPDC077715 TaxID=3155539 RepID=UPI003448B514